MADHLGSDDLRADSLRRDLLAHCYRMLGSVRNAETVSRDVFRRADLHV
ncbi:hypothetical protein [Kribbella sp. VKM Ac-2568]|nr:hypothetical protein [Kribbella sp. VKM Ac-2568]TCM39680.1 hypothetical protein EV648_114202 [Kribbella sp. VKM Ac-2568]